MNSPKFSQIFGPKTANFVEKKRCIRYLCNNCRPPVADQYPAHRHKSISTGALDNKMSKFSCCFFGNSTNVTGTAYSWGLLIANHLDQSVWSTNQKNSAKVKSNLLHSVLEVHKCVAPFSNQGKLHEFDAEKPISWAKPTHFEFFTINFAVWSHRWRCSKAAHSIMEFAKYKSLCMMRCLWQIYMSPQAGEPKFLKG